MPTDTTEKGLEDLIVAAMTDAAAPAGPPEPLDEGEAMGEDEAEGADLDALSEEAIA